MATEVMVEEEDDLTKKVNNVITKLMDGYAALSCLIVFNLTKHYSYFVNMYVWFCFMQNLNIN